jgi:hypothetical protein
VVVGIDSEVAATRSNSMRRDLRVGLLAAAFVRWRLDGRVS